MNLCGFLKVEHYNQKDPYPLPFIVEIFNIIFNHETYSFLDGLFGYHYISIALEDWYKLNYFCY
jgi:hypothetical protein